MFDDFTVVNESSTIWSTEASLVVPKKGVTSWLV